MGVANNTAPLDQEAISENVNNSSKPEDTAPPSAPTDDFDKISIYGVQCNDTYMEVRFSINGTLSKAQDYRLIVSKNSAQDKEIGVGTLNTTESSQGIVINPAYVADLEIGKPYFLKVVINNKNKITSFTKK